MKGVNATSSDDDRWKLVTRATILVPISAREESRAAVPFASWLGRGLNAEIVLMTVREPPESSRDTVEEHLQMKKLLNRESARFSGVAVREHLDMSGDPVRGILKAADEEDADLIVMATHGRTGLLRFLNRNFADEVARRADIPVATVRAR